MQQQDGISSIQLLFFFYAVLGVSRVPVIERAHVVRWLVKRHNASNLPSEPRVQCGLVIMFGTEEGKLL
ncbi:MAG: hypothetical protein ACTSUE_06650 [Promethearchaeota archaeon]